MVLLSSEKGRKKLGDSLHHSYDFDPRWAEYVGDRKTAGDIAALLRAAGAGPTCYCISSERDLDGETVPLENALERVVQSGFGHYLVCIPDRLAYFESEDRDERYILRRNPPNLLPED
jgi:hypothetical protein